MFQYIFLAVFLTGVLGDRKCLDITDYHRVDLANVPDGVWSHLAVPGDERYTCMKVTLTPSTNQDIHKIRNKDKCEQVHQHENETITYDFDKAVKKVSFSKAFRDTLLTDQDGQLRILLNACYNAFKVEFRKHQSNYVMLIWNSSNDHPRDSNLTPFAIRVADDETKRCFDAIKVTYDFCR